MRVLIIYGSLREQSINKALARNAKSLAPQGMEVELLGVDGFPVFSEDLEAVGTPEHVSAYKKKIQEASGIIVATPEYNRSMPGALKNMLDWTSRGEVPWKGKRVAVFGASDGLRGASFAQYDVKRILLYLDAQVMGQPEFYFSEAPKKLDAKGTITDMPTKERLEKFMRAFQTFAEAP